MVDLSIVMLVYQRVNLWFSYGFPRVFPLKPPFSYGFPMVFLWELASVKLGKLDLPNCLEPLELSGPQDRQAAGARDVVILWLKCLDP